MLSPGAPLPPPPGPPTTLSVSPTDGAQSAGGNGNSASAACDSGCRPARDRLCRIGDVAGADSGTCGTASAPVATGGGAVAGVASASLPTCDEPVLVAQHREPLPLELCN